MRFLCSHRVSGSISSPLYFASHLRKYVCIGPQQRPDALYGTGLVLIQRPPQQQRSAAISCKTNFATFLCGVIYSR